MCGICGIVALEEGGAPPDRHVLSAMNRALTHRGPDDDGMLLDGPAGLAMRRLSIIDLPGGHQPIANENGTVHVILNGEGIELKARNASTACGSIVRSKPGCRASALSSDANETCLFAVVQ